MCLPPPAKLDQIILSDGVFTVMSCVPVQVVTAMGRTWHPEHFVCTHCQEEIGSRNFFEREGQPYCEQDYHNLFSPRCYYCNGPILDVGPPRCPHTPAGRGQPQ